MTDIDSGLSSDGHAAMLEAAERLESDNQLWIVLYGVYSEEFIAFPRFNVPSGMTMLVARYPAALAATGSERSSGWLPDREGRRAAPCDAMIVRCTRV